MLSRTLLVASLVSLIAAGAPARAEDDLKPGGGDEIGTVVEAYLSPWQEPGEEKDTPRMIPDHFRAHDPSTLRADRKGFGHGRVRFTKDLSRAYVDVALENINPADVMMFHIHCGPPDILGPIMIDFGQFDDLKAKLTGGHYSFVVTNKTIEDTIGHGEGLTGLLLVGCPIIPSNPILGKVKTVAGMEYIARKGELYFNLHTKGHMFYGDLRGQLIPVAR
jgi:hypothetical protein